ncbi:hypothetical protein GGI42DRAFT_147263 [Trichoderma sp. SZMC 28013]
MASQCRVVHKSPPLMNSSLAPPAARSRCGSHAIGPLASAAARTSQCEVSDVQLFFGSGIVARSWWGSEIGVPAGAGAGAVDGLLFGLESYSALGQSRTVPACPRTVLYGVLLCVSISWSWSWSWSWRRTSGMGWGSRGLALLPLAEGVSILVPIALHARLVDWTGWGSVLLKLAPAPRASRRRQRTEQRGSLIMGTALRIQALRFT